MLREDWEPWGHMHYMTFDLVCVTGPPGMGWDQKPSGFSQICTNQTSFDFLWDVLHFLLAHIDQMKAKAHTAIISTYSESSSSSGVNDKLSLHFHHTREEVRKMYIYSFTFRLIAVPAVKTSLKDVQRVFPCHLVDLNFNPAVIREQQPVIFYQQVGFFCLAVFLSKFKG